MYQIYTVQWKGKFGCGDWFYPPPPSFSHDSPYSMSINPCLMDSKRHFCLLLYYVFINELTIGFMDIYTVLLSLLRNKGLFKVKVSEKGVCIQHEKHWWVSQISCEWSYRAFSQFKSFILSPQDIYTFTLFLHQVVRDVCLRSIRSNEM